MKPKKTLLLGLLLAAAAALAFVYRDRGTEVVETVPPQGGLAFAYVDVAGVSGYTMRNRSGREGAKNFILEAMPPGVAVADFDGDGWLDLYAPNGNDIVRYDRKTKQIMLLPPEEAPRNALYWNREGVRFEEGARAAGVDDALWAFGTVAGDLDNDGRPDLYVCNWGVNRLYLNNGDRTFREVGREVGAAGRAGDWSSGACFFDYDNDGDLDIYVAQYGDIQDLLDRPEITRLDAQGRPDGKACDWKGIKVYCGPIGVIPANDVVFRNLLAETGKLAFEDVSEELGITFRVDDLSVTQQSNGPYYGFQPIAWDIDGDGWQDVFVANDSVKNVCWMNREAKRFVDEAPEMSLANSMDDLVPQASMGVALGDVNKDGLQDLAMSEFSHDHFNLLLAERLPTGRVVFNEKASKTGLRRMTFAALGWGTLLFDPDQDGDLDIFFACGHVYPEVDGHVFDGQGTSYQQQNLLILNEDPRLPKLRDVSHLAGPGIADLRKASRAAIVFDFDNDGDPDIATSELNDSPSLLRCDLDPARGGHWLQVRLVGNPAQKVPMDPAGTVVTVIAGDLKTTRVHLIGSSFQSSEDPRLHFGLAGHTRVDRIEVAWTNGARTLRADVAADQLVTIRCP